MGDNAAGPNSVCSNICLTGSRPDYSPNICGRFEATLRRHTNENFVIAGEEELETKMVLISASRFSACKIPETEFCVVRKTNSNIRFRGLVL